MTTEAVAPLTLDALEEIRRTFRYGGFELPEALRAIRLLLATLDSTREHFADLLNDERRMRGEYAETLRGYRLDGEALEVGAGRKILFQCMVNDLNAVRSVLGLENGRLFDRLMTLSSLVRPHDIETGLRKVINERDALRVELARLATTPKEPTP